MTYNQPCDWCGIEPTHHTADMYYACREHSKALERLVEGFTAPNKEDYE